MKKIIGVILFLLLWFTLFHGEGSKNNPSNESIENPVETTDSSEGNEFNKDNKLDDSKSSQEHANDDNSSVITEDTSQVENKADEPTIISEETYTFDNSDFIINGLTVHIDSISLKRGYKPGGYAIAVSYNVENHNSNKASFFFSSLDGNCLEYNGAKAILAAQVSGSNTHITSLSLEPNEKTDTLVGDFYASSKLYDQMINGVTYGPIDIDELYSGEKISLDLTMFGYVGDLSESIVVTFEIIL